jgi:putative PIN family toxin of toxin-antitoxin system
MPRQVVLDTSVLVAALRSQRGASYEVLSRVGGAEFELSVSVPLVLEYEAAAKAQARELGLTHADIDDVVDYLCSVAHPRQIFYLWRPVLRDPKDDMVLELAVEAGCEAIITHNLRDFVGAERFGITVLTPGAFLQQLEGRR